MDGWIHFFQSGDYVLLANIFASASQWNKVTRMREAIRNRGVQKPEPGKKFWNVFHLQPMRDQKVQFQKKKSSNFTLSPLLYDYKIPKKREPEVNSTQTVEIDVLPIDHLYDAVGGPELDTLRVHGLLVFFCCYCCCAPFALFN